jgi:hypothetical protein
MSYIKPIEYSNYIANLLSEGIEDQAPEMEATKTVSVKEAIQNLTTDEREQLQDYAASLVEIHKEMKRLVAKGKAGANVQEETGGDMMNLTMPSTEENI